MASPMPKKDNQTRLSILRAVHWLYDHKGIPPTIREIGQYMGIESTSHISYHIDALCRSGDLVKDKGISRGIRPARPLPPRPGYESHSPTIPLLGRIQAGEPIPIPTSDFSHYDPESGFKMPEMLANVSGNLFALEVKGDSMRDMLISEGDIVILRQTQHVLNGQIVAAWIRSSGETTLKSYYLENGHVRLQPANPDYKPIIISDPDDVEIQGELVSLIRTYLQ